MPNNKELLIKARNLKVIYDKGTPAETIALHDTDADIYKEEYVIFFGPSGCGKSTLLYVIAGIDSEFTGEVTVAGNNLHEMDSDQIAQFHRKTIGMIFQSFNLVPSLTILDNIALPQVFQGIGKTERYAKARALLERFGLQEFEKRLPTQLSGGQQQRCAIARALISNPPVILADEPVGNLDSKVATTVLNTLMDLNKIDKKTVILVTHNPAHLDFADRIFFMKDGQVLSVQEKRETTEANAKMIAEGLALVGQKKPEPAPEKK